MKEVVLILPQEPSELLKDMIGKVLDSDVRTITRAKDLPNMKNKKILFAVELNEIGSSNILNDMFAELYRRGHDSLENSEAALLVHSDYALFTKTYAQYIILLANMLGCSFVGRPLVEATKDLGNFVAMEGIYKMAPRDICLYQCEELKGRFLGWDSKATATKNLLVVHSSNRETSNTLMLWDMVKEHLDNISINEINLGNGSIMDCKGCNYKTCKHFGKQSKCFYGGIIVEEVYPAILESDAILFVCPNYNDMITANIVATINRLTALYRKTKFYKKKIYSIIVSGYSGGEALAKQLISSLNMNKTFYLPPYFSLMAVANHKGDIEKVDNIENLAREFALKIMKY
ncbi:MAG: NAD(P)H-dependent oxidoreductase [Tissierellaceae bacterium]